MAYHDVLCPEASATRQAGQDLRDRDLIAVAEHANAETSRQLSAASR
jgi:hypothetical protein